jgi:hypothetical protein
VVVQYKSPSNGRGAARTWTTGRGAAITAQGELKDALRPTDLLCFMQNKGTHRNVLLAS